MEEKQHKNSVLPVSLQISNTPTVADLKNLVLYTSVKTLDDSVCECQVTDDSFCFRTQTPQGRYKILSEWKFADFIGIEVVEGYEYGDDGGKSIRAIGTKFQSGQCCWGEPNLNKRVIEKSRLYHGKNDKVIITVRDIIMTTFWNYCKKNYGAGIPETDTSYIHPQNLKPWEKKAIVYINPYSGLRKAGKLFHTIEDYLIAAGFRMDTVTTFRENQVFEEMALMDGNTFKSYYCRLVFSGDGLVHELINGYYHRQDHTELKLRFAAFPGGSANSASFMGHWSYN